MQIRKPLSLQEIKELDLLPKGDYKFKVIESAIHHKGEITMLKVKLMIDYNNRKYFVTDFLSEDFMQKKLPQFAITCGLYEQYASGYIVPESFMDKEGWASIYIQPSKDPNYSDKNSVSKYFQKETEVIESDFGDKDIPF